MGPSLVGLSAAVHSKIVCCMKYWCCLKGLVHYLFFSWLLMEAMEASTEAMEASMEAVEASMEARKLP